MAQPKQNKACRGAARKADKDRAIDGATTEVNFKPNSRSGGNVSDDGKFSALVQLDGVVNSNRQHDIVDAYVDEVNLIHTP